MMAALMLALLVGFPVARRADREAPLLRLLGESFLLGIGICAFTLFAISIWGMRWSVLLALFILLIVVCVSAKPAKGGPHTRFHPIDLLTLTTVVGYALFATIAPPVEIDFIADWGLKARIFSLHGGIDWDFLQNAWYRWDHPDYPPLLPLTFDWMTLFAREWSPQWLGILYPALGLALLAIMRSLFADEFASPLLASLATLAIAPLALSPWVGIAEGPLVAFGTAAVLLLRRGIVTPAALLIGLAAMTKNEGLAMLLALILALAITNPRVIPRLWPALIIATPWLIARAIFGLGTDIAQGSMLQRAFARLSDPRPLLTALGHYSAGAPLFWIGVTMAIALSWRLLRTEGLALLWIAIQFTSYIAAYLITEKDVAWHVRWSWERLVSHLTPTLAFVAIVLLFRFAARGTMTSDA